jgi:hypothetical protein
MCAHRTLLDACEQGDFGNARAAEAQPQHCADDDEVGAGQSGAQGAGEDMVHGDRRYVAPEILDFGRAPPDTKTWCAADIFSLGASLYGGCLFPVVSFPLSGSTKLVDSTSVWRGA